MISLTYYPGCSLKTSSSFYEKSLKKVFDFYGIILRELDDWSCCGASAATTVNKEAAFALAARNLALAERKNLHFFAPCSACYLRSKETAVRIRSDSTLRGRVNSLIEPLSCSGTLEVINIIQVFFDFLGPERIANSVQYGLEGLKVVPYYGCVLTRLMDGTPFDDRENPVSMDHLLGILGANVIPWQYKTECCGASKTITDKAQTAKFSGRIMDMAFRLGAEAIVTTCPLCQLNLDLLPNLGKGHPSIPVLFLTEIFELALFGSISVARSHMISPGTLAGMKSPLKKDGES